MNTAAQLSTDLFTNPNGSLGDYKPWRRASGEAGNIILKAIAKSCNRWSSRFPQFSDGEAYKSDIGLSNDDDFFDQYIKDNSPHEPDDKIYRCSKGFIWGESSQNNFYKMITCGKEWCGDCGKMHSIPHDRRVNRKSKITDQTIQDNFLALHQNHIPVQYIVVTIPPEIRKYYRNHKALNDFRTYWRRKLKLEGRRYGITRFHWCGKDGYYWHPHINILCDGGFITKEKLREWRSELGRWFKMYHKLEFTPVANIRTAYTRDSDKIKFWLRYVTRATQTKYNKENENTIHGFRNCAPFKDSEFKIPKYIKEEKEKDLVQQAAAEGFDLLPDGTREKIVWKMKLVDKLQKDGSLKKIWRPEVVLIEHTRIDELQLIRRGFWKEAKICKPPPEPKPEIIICPF